MADERIEVRFTGHVQGVGFRYTTLGIAGRRPVVGYVRNLPDGAVQLVAEGERRELDALIADVQQAFAGHIRETRVDRQSPTGEFHGFVIRH